MSSRRQISTVNAISIVAPAILALLLFLALITASAGQKNKRPVAGKQVQPAPGELTELIVEKFERRKVGMAEIIYSPRSDNTTALLKVPAVRKLEIIWLEIGFTQPGRELVKPESLQFILTSEGKRQSIFKNAKTVSVEADGQSYEVKVIGKKSLWDSDNWRHALYGNIGFSEFERIANSRKASLHLGALVFDLVDGHLQGMRDVISVVR